MSHIIRDSRTDNAFGESEKSKEDPSDDKQDVVGVFNNLRGVLHVTDDSVDAKENITGVMNEQHEDSDSQVVGQV